MAKRNDSSRKGRRNTIVGSKDKKRDTKKKAKFSRETSEASIKVDEDKEGD